MIFLYTVIEVIPLYPSSKNKYFNLYIDYDNYVNYNYTIPKNCKNISKGDFSFNVNKI